MTLGEKQEKFAIMLGELLEWCHACGYKVRIGEVWRPREMARLYAAQGRGIVNSLHCLKLAVDLAYVRDPTGKPLETFEEWEELGLLWESLGGAWGGRFRNRDVYHFSLPHRGVR